MVFVNVIKSYRDVVAICDEEILGQKFEKGDLQLDVKESFYKGEKTSEEEALKILQSFSNEDATFNIAGNKSIEIALKAGILHEDKVNEIENIRFALVLL